MKLFEADNKCMEICDYCKESYIHCCPRGYLIGKCFNIYGCTGFIPSHNVQSIHMLGIYFNSTGGEDEPQDEE